MGGWVQWRLLLCLCCVKAAWGSQTVDPQLTAATAQWSATAGFTVHATFSAPLLLESFNGSVPGFQGMDQAGGAVLANHLSVACTPNNNNNNNNNTNTLSGAAAAVLYAQRGDVVLRFHSKDAAAAALLREVSSQTDAGVCVVACEPSAWFGPWPVVRVVSSPDGDPLAAARVPLRWQPADAPPTTPAQATLMQVRPASHAVLHVPPDSAAAAAFAEVRSDTAEQARSIPMLMDILEFMVKLLLPPVFDPVIEDMGDKFSHSLNVEFGNAVVAATPKDTVMLLEPALKRNLTNLLPDAIAGSLTQVLVDRLVAAVAPPVSAAALARLDSTVPAAVASSLAITVPDRLSKTLPILLERSLLLTLTQSLTPALTHSLVPSLSVALQPDAVDLLRHPCTACFLRPPPRPAGKGAPPAPACPPSCAAVLSRLLDGSYHAAYYAAYYSAFYTKYYADAVIALDNVQHPPDQRAAVAAENENGDVSESSRRVVAASGARQPVSHKIEH